MSSEKAGGKDMKAEGREGREGKDMKAEGHEGSKTNMNAQSREGDKSNLNAKGAQERSGNMNAQTKSGTERSQTTGQAAAGAKLSGEQRTQITSVIREQHVTPATNVDFALTVGTRVPRDRIHLVALPEKVVTIYPEWRGYEFFLVRDEIVVVDPRTLEIVDVIPA
jgi:hypothetical protein